MAPSGASGDCVNAAGSSRGKEGDPEFNLLPADEKRMLLKQRKRSAEKATTIKRTRQPDAGAALAVVDGEGVIFTSRAHTAAPAVDDDADTTVRLWICLR